MADNKERNPRGGHRVGSGAPQGNQNGRKETPATAQLQLRVTPDEKTSWQAAASEAGVSLSEWARQHLNKAAK